MKNWLTFFEDLCSHQRKQQKSQNRQKYTKQLYSSISVIQKRQNFQKILKQIYYYKEVHAVGKITEIYCDAEGDQESAVKDNNKWRTMTKNYILRNNLLNNSVKNLEILKNQIKIKGEELIKLKKILVEVKTVHNSLKEKEKSVLITDTKRKQKLSAENFKITQVQMMLYEKQAQLDFKKKRNDQMSLRMDSLNFIQQDKTLLQEQIIKNSKEILQQQHQIKLFKYMRKQIPKQKQIIQKLQKLFQKKQLDKQMNNLLKDQSQKLEKIRKKKKIDLENVYNLLKQKNSQQNSIKTKVQAAQRQLIQLNQYYAKLTGL